MIKMKNAFTIPTSTGYKIPAIFKRHGREIVLLCHGITSEKTEGGFFTALTSELERGNLSTLSFDFRGHGESSIPFEQANISGMVEDLIQVYAYASSQGYSVSFVCASFGASVFLLAQSKFSFPETKVVFINPVTDYFANFVSADTEWGRSFAPQISNRLFWEMARYPIPARNVNLGRSFISELALLEPQSVTVSKNISMLVMHGDADTVISQESCRRFVNRQNNNSLHFIGISGAGHGFDGFQEQVFKLISEFLSNE